MCAGSIFTNRNISVLLDIHIRNHNINFILWLSTLFFIRVNFLHLFLFVRLLNSSPRLHLTLVILRSFRELLVPLEENNRNHDQANEYYS
mmetsp:Transcript_43945/g.42505  ORF Transcript_43945/g.42505 Transcript_43945/m.42505 type:complete len:90 (+) Transcript_43945:354-623(+)